MTYRITIFPDRAGATKQESETTFADLCAWIDNAPEFESKEQCPLFTQTTFGNNATEKGSLRSAANALQCYGVECDYDAELITPQQAHEALKAADITHYLYTSASHRPEAPRWRAIVPFEWGWSVDERKSAVEKCNTILGGKLSAESFTLSQPFYLGKVKGVPFESYKWFGRAPFQALDIPRTPWRGERNFDGSFRVATELLIDDLKAGREVHEAIKLLAWRGYSEEDLTELVNKYGPSWDRPERIKRALRDDIPRAVKSRDTKRVAEVDRVLSTRDVPPMYVQPAPQPQRIAAPASDLFASVSAMTSVYVQTEWLIKGFVEHNSFAEIFGEPNVGKSFIVIDWALSVALGRRWYDCRVKKRPVLYLAGEGHSGYSRRFKAWQVYHGISESEWAGAELYCSRRAVDLLDNLAGQEMWDEVTRLGIKPGLIVIDTLSRMTPGMDESAAPEMSRFVQWCDKVRAAYNCTILVVHHSGLGDKKRGRGSSVLKGATDAEMGLEAEDDGRVKLFCTKMREGKKFGDMRFRFQDVTLPWVNQPDDETELPSAVTSAVLLKDDKPPKEKATTGGKKNPVQHMILEHLRGRDEPMFADALKTEICQLLGDDRNRARKFDAAFLSAINAGQIVHDSETNKVSLAFA